MNATVQGPEVVERGPNWLFVRVPEGALDPQESGEVGSSSLCERLWEVSRRHFVYRVVLELQDLDEIDDRAAEEIEKLRSILRERGGALRLCGVPTKCSRKLLSMAHQGATPPHF